MTVPQEESDDTVRIRPYARLLIMLGEQLIKNDTVALVELIKNSYDADAALVRIDIDPDLSDSQPPATTSGESPCSPQPKPSIILVDDGDGMTETVVRDHWLNPATAMKEHRKETKPLTTKNRFIQGEKGIGRFAIFKIGSVARIVTRARGSDSEIVLDYDLRFLDDPDAKPVFLDQVRVAIEIRAPEIFDGLNEAGLASQHGTSIEIRSLRNLWSTSAVGKVFNEVSRLQPIIPASGFKPPSKSQRFEFEFRRYGQILDLHDAHRAQLQRLFTDRSVLRIVGLFDDESASLTLDVNGTEFVYHLGAPPLSALRIHREYFGKKLEKRSVQSLECGPFSFSAFAFDLSAKAPLDKKLDAAETAIVRAHRVYLYRDGVRVQPYGAADDDWLELDVIRGTQGANRILGNDQTVGFVHISHAENARLRDKTNREGLLDDGEAYADFKTVIQIAFSLLRTTHFAKYSAELGRSRKAQQAAARDLAADLDTISEDPSLQPELRKKLGAATASYKRERSALEARIATTEDLAGVGLSVEAATHDIVASGERALKLSQGIKAYVDDKMPSNTYLRDELDSLIELQSFVTSRLGDIAGLFVSTGRRKGNVNIGDIARRVQKIFAPTLRADDIDLEVSEPNGQLVAKTIDAAVFQALINIVDNSIHWVSIAGQKQAPKILIEVDATAGEVRVSDSGPGVMTTDVPFIFEPFYSAKGEDGKGLGLYIARSVGERAGFEVLLSAAAGPNHGAEFTLEFHERANGE